MEDLGSRAALQGEKDLIWYPAEVNTSIRPGWFYHTKEDNQVKSLEELISIYCGSVGGNATFLLNVPPMPNGCSIQMMLPGWQNWDSGREVHFPQSCRICRDNCVLRRCRSSGSECSHRHQNHLVPARDRCQNRSFPSGTYFQS